MLWVLPKYEYMPIKKAMNFCKLISTYEKKISIIVNIYALCIKENNFMKHAFTQNMTN